MAEDLTTEQIVQKLSKHIPENLIDEVLSLSKDFITQLLSECTLKDYEDRKEKDLQPKNYDELKKIPTTTLWNNTFQFYIPYEVLNKYMPKLVPSIKKFVEWSINNSTLMQNSKDAHQKEFFSLINQNLGKKIKEPDYAHTSWVISANPEIYDSINAFRQYGGDVQTIGFPIPQNCYSLKELSSKMMDSEKYLKRILNEEINITR